MRAPRQSVVEVVELEKHKIKSIKVTPTKSLSCQPTKNVSLQWPQVTLHIPGTVGMGGVTGLGARLMIRLQVVRGQAILCDEVLQMSRQLHGQRTYFLPGGAFRIGVASMHRGHLTTCWSRLLVMSIMP